MKCDPQMLDGAIGLFMREEALSLSSKCVTIIYLDVGHDSCAHAKVQWILEQKCSNRLLQPIDSIQVKIG